MGDARELDQPTESADVVLLFGPLYHLVRSGDRLKALREAGRVLRPGGLLFASGISKYASLFDGVARGFIRDRSFRRIVRRDMMTGQHRNPSNHPHYFTTAFFHHPNELKFELEEAGFEITALLSIDGPLSFMAVEKVWQDFREREFILSCLRRVEGDPTIAGASAHVMAIGKK